MRYHKKIKFEHKTELKKLVKKLNNRNFSFSKHCIEKMKNRIDNDQLEKTLYMLKDLKVNYEDIFEYYHNGKNIFKIACRFQYNYIQDIILLISNNKKLITVYFNNKSDNHKTLKAELYAS